MFTLFITFASVQILQSAEFLPIGNRNRITIFHLMLQKLDGNKTFLFDRILLIVLIDLSITEIGNIFFMAHGLYNIITSQQNRPNPELSPGTRPATTTAPR